MAIYILLLLLEKPTNESLDWPRTSDEEAQSMTAEQSHNCNISIADLATIFGSVAWTTAKFRLVHIIKRRLSYFQWRQVNGRAR